MLVAPTTKVWHTIVRFWDLRGRFTLWPKVKRPSNSTNQIARNQDLGLSTLHTRGQSPKAVSLQNAYMEILLDVGNGLSKEVWVEHEC
jgi:hypothetical protein